MGNRRVCQLFLGPFRSQWCTTPEFMDHALARPLNYTGGVVAHLSAQCIREVNPGLTHEGCVLSTRPYRPSPEFQSQLQWQPQAMAIWGHQIYARWRKLPIKPQSLSDLHLDHVFIVLRDDAHGYVQDLPTTDELQSCKQETNLFGLSETLGTLR